MGLFAACFVVCYSFLFMPALADPVKIQIPEPKFVRIAPIGEEHNGLYSAEITVVVTNRNVDDLTEEKIQAIEQVFSTYHANLKMYLTEYSQLVDTPAKALKIATFQTGYVGEFRTQLQKTQEPIERYIEHNESPNSYDILSHEVSFIQHLWYSQKRIKDYFVGISTKQYNRLQTSIWTGPPKHMYERYTEVHHRNFRYTG